MLYVFTGDDVVTVRGQTHEFLRSYEKRSVSVTHLSAPLCTEDALRSLAGGASLFGDEQVVLIDTPSEEAEAFGVVTQCVQVLAESENTFVLIERKLLAKESNILKKYANEYHELKATQKKERFNVFALAEALLRRDRKSLWVLLMRAHNAGVSAEEIIGTLFWQVKTMRLAAQTGSAQEAGLKPFVYKKAQQGLLKYHTDEVDELSRGLLRAYHEGHRGTVDIDNALEKFVLSL